MAQIRDKKDKSSNMAYALRQVYVKHLVQYENHCHHRPAAEDVGLTPPADTSGGLSDFDKMVANSEDDLDVLGAVAALMDVPGGGAPQPAYAEEEAMEEDEEEPALKARRAAGIFRSGQAAPYTSNTEYALQLKAEAERIRVPDNIYTLVCELCKGGHHEEKIILCDKCDRGCHLFCLSPPLTKVPQGDWVCPLCVAEEADSRAFHEGEVYTIEKFEAMAQEYKANWFSRSEATSQVRFTYKKFWHLDLEYDMTACLREMQVPWEKVEEAFWEVVEGGEEPVEVLYGADIDTGKHGSGFPTQPKKGNERLEGDAATYAAHPWNLNNFPKLSGSLLGHIDNNIAGVTQPWLYIGMMFSSFCWHIEDHMFYSSAPSLFGSIVNINIVSQNLNSINLICLFPLLDFITEPVLFQSFISNEYRIHII